MKQRLKAVSCALVLALLFSVVMTGGPVFGPFGVDVVSAASEPWEEPAPAPAPTPKPAPAPKPATPAPKPAAPATKPAPAPAAPVASVELGSRLLVVGSFGADVKTLQEKLNADGASLKVDGFFGPKTQNALKSFQSKNGLVADGVFGPKTNAKFTVATAPTEPSAPVDAVSSATQAIVTDEASLLNGVSEKGAWIVIFEDNFTTKEELVLNGEFINKDKPARKLALYTQDADHNVLERFTLTAPKLSVKSPSARIQSGTFKGDVVVYAPNFQLRDAVVDGDLYFATQEAKDTFQMDDKSSVTGSKILADIDVVATASLVHDGEAFAKALAADGKWIICPLRDLVIDQPLVLDGVFFDKNDPTKDLKRKIGLYTHNDPADKKKATHSFTLTAPSLTIKSPFATLQYGTFVGDIYVEANNFSLVNNEVIGNVYFATQSAMDTFVNTNSTISGEQVLREVDVVSGPTQAIVADEASLLEGVSKDGAWIVIFEDDFETDKELVLEGNFINKDKPNRKLALYTQDADHNVLESFTLTAPKLSVKSPNARIQNGTFKGDVVVYAPNFSLKGSAVVDGDVYFATQVAKDTFVMDETASITGDKILADIDVVATASLVHDGDAFVDAIAEDGKWIICPLRDLVIDQDLVLEGVFHDKNDPAKDLKRKIGLYTHNDPTDKKIATHSFTLTAPSLTIKSPSATLQYGTFIGDIYVEENNFSLVKHELIGNIYFANEEVKSTFVIDEFSTVSGVQEVKAK